ncbi:MAG: hypothetical protein ACYSTL_01645 [Planctomycetota bacterium]|jgi:hypothetical protein
MHEHHSCESSGVLGNIAHELKDHAPFTFLGALSGILIAVVFVYARIPERVSHVLFATFHPGHVFLSAVATTAMYRLHGKRSMLATLIVGYVGAVGIGTLSDSLIPYLSERLLELHDEHIDAHAHIGFIEEWYLVNPLAFAGIALACWRPSTKIPHAGHVLLSTWASLFHILMAMGHDGTVSPLTLILIPLILFLAVWAPCCTSDIIFPLLFTSRRDQNQVDKETSS